MLGSVDMVSLGADMQGQLQAMVKRKSKKEENAQVKQEAKEIAKVKAPNPPMFWWDSKKKMNRSLMRIKRKLRQYRQPTKRLNRSRNGNWSEDTTMRC
jgi:hypothetical protein